MQKTTITLPLELKFLAEQEAHRRGVSLSEVIRISLKELTEESAKKNEADPLFNFNLVYKGPCPEDLSVNYDEHLHGEH